MTCWSSSDSSMDSLSSSSKLSSLSSPSPSPSETSVSIFSSSSSALYLSYFGIFISLAVTDLNALNWCSSSSSFVSFFMKVSTWSMRWFSENSMSFSLMDLPILANSFASSSSMSFRLLALCT